MKQITCNELGGPDTCHEVFKGETPEQIIEAGWKHVQEAHPDVAQNIMNNGQEANDKWMEEFKQKFPSLQDADESAPEAEAAA